MNDKIMLLRLVLAAVVAVSGMGSALAQGSSAPLVATASDLQFAIEEVAAAFRSETGDAVRIAPGSSGNFARQIRQGAPFELFLSADEEYVEQLARDGFTRDRGTLYAVGRIVIIVPTGSPLKADGTLEDLRSALARGQVTKFAIANPEHAPYGKRAEEVLRHTGLWEAVKPKLVLGENVSQAAQFATSANAQGGIIAYSLALSPKVSSRGTYALIPAEWHSPLRQRMVLTRKAGAVVAKFYDFMQRPAARAILRKYGFGLPGEAS